MTDLWNKLKDEAHKGRPILLYGMGNGADKILTVCEAYEDALKAIYSEFVKA